MDIDNERRIHFTRRQQVDPLEQPVTIDKAAVLQPFMRGKVRRSILGDGLVGIGRSGVLIVIQGEPCIVMVVVEKDMIADNSGQWTGLTTDLYRIVSGVVLGDAAKEKFVPLIPQ